MDEKEEPIKVDKWDQNAVRFALDDAAKKIILDLGYCENFRLIDSRLAICTTAVFAAAFALVYDWLYPFPASRNIIIICVVTYGLLMCLLTAYTTFVEKSIFLIAHQKDPIGTEPDVVWTLSSTMAKYDNYYTLNIERSEDTKSRCLSSAKKCVGEFFDENGELHMDAFRPVVMDLHKSLVSETKKAE